MKSQIASKILPIITLRAVVIGLCTTVTLNCCHGANQEIFFEPGFFSIATPESEPPDVPFVWKKIRTVPTPITTTHYFICTQADRQPPPLVLAVDERSASTDAQKKPIVKAHYKALRGMVVRSGFKIDSKQPKISTPVKDRVVYGVSGFKEDGSKIFVAGMIHFKNRIYMIQSLASSAAEAKRLIAVGDTFQELFEPDALGPISNTP